MKKMANVLLFCMIVLLVYILFSLAFSDDFVNFFLQDIGVAGSF